MQSIVTTALDATTVLTIELATVEATGRTLRITGAAAAGVVDVCTPTALNTVAVGTPIEITSNGGTTVGVVELVLTIQRSS
jgi:hypothetical protein